MLGFGGCLGGRRPGLQVSGTIIRAFGPDDRSTGPVPGAGRGLGRLGLTGGHAGFPNLGVSAGVTELLAAAKVDPAFARAAHWQCQCRDSQAAMCSLRARHRASTPRLDSENGT